MARAHWYQSPSQCLAAHLLVAFAVLFTCANGRPTSRQDVTESESMRAAQTVIPPPPIDAINDGSIFSSIPPASRRLAKKILGRRCTFRGLAPRVAGSYIGSFIQRDVIGAAGALSGGFQTVDIAQNSSIGPGQPLTTIIINQNFEAPYYGKVFTFNFTNFLGGAGVGAVNCMFDASNTEAQCVRAFFPDESLTQIQIQSIDRNTCQVLEISKTFQVPLRIPSITPTMGDPPNPLECVTGRGPALECRYSSTAFDQYYLTSTSPTS